MRQVLSAGVRYGYIESNPVEHVRRLKVARRAKPFLQLDQVGRWSRRPTRPSVRWC
jgi:hypothetical protein